MNENHGIVRTGGQCRWSNLDDVASCAPEAPRDGSMRTSYTRTMGQSAPMAIVCSRFGSNAIPVVPPMSVKSTNVETRRSSRKSHCST
eukprot:m.881626 g.881626  ORF g.881626 m.881626 type:complete len:88 (-) comp23596_c0_seq11:1074-1337(-)